MLQALFVLTCITGLCTVVAAFCAIPAVRRDFHQLGDWLAGSRRFPAADIGLKLGIFTALILVIAGIR